MQQPFHHWITSGVCKNILGQGKEAITQDDELVLGRALHVLVGIVRELEDVTLEGRPIVLRCVPIRTFGQWSRGD